MDNVISSFFSGGIGVIKAVLILVLACIVASVVKSVVVKLFTKTKLNALLGKQSTANGEKEKTVDFIGKLVHLLVFLLFVPGIFEALGMSQVSVPILNLLNILWGYLPNILAAVLVLWVGFFIARLVRELLVPVFGKLRINALQEKAGIQTTDAAKLSNTLAYIVYVLILIPVIIAALQMLNIQAISTPAIKMLDTVFAFIPNILAALVIITVGCMVAKFAANIVESMIASAGLDAKLASQLEEKNKNFVLSKVIGTCVYVIMVIFFVVESLGVLHLEILSNIGNAVIGFMPSVLAAVLILVACYICSSLAVKALAKSGHHGIALSAKIAIYTIGGFMILNELGIAQAIVNTVFILIIAALAIAFAISFGIGGRSFAEKTLKKIEDACDKDSKDK